MYVSMNNVCLNEQERATRTEVGEWNSYTSRAVARLKKLPRM